MNQMNQISIIRNQNEVIDEKPLDLILAEIRTGYYKEEIETLYNFYSRDMIGHYENRKRDLLSFAPMGVYRISNSQIFLRKYSHYVMLDTGTIHPLEVAESGRLLKTDPHTLAFFKSPSRRSLKILVEVSTASAYFADAYLQVCDHYSKLLWLPMRNRRDQMPGMCYYSYDPGLYLNPNHKIFKVEIPEDF